MFDIKKSEKNHIESPEHFIVVRDGVVYLRIVGEEGNYSVMTATAGEDYIGVRSFVDQDALVAAAISVSGVFNGQASVQYDFLNRHYAIICSCEYISDAYRVAEILFKILDADELVQAQNETELKKD